MIDKYKDYLKKNIEEIFFIFTICAGATLLFLTITGGIIILTIGGTFVRNSTELNVYRENLATFQKCAEKVTDVSLIESYCGETPSEPTLIW